ncbi:MAG: hypothetical protein WC989_05280 [Micavibrio sp.]
MPVSIRKIVWLLIAVGVSAYVAYLAYGSPLKFIPLTDLLATILSILIGISLAISAVLSSRPSLSQSDYKDEAERKRMEKIIKSDDMHLIDGQAMIFWSYYLALILAVVLKWLSLDEPVTGAEMHIKILSSAFSFIACFSLLWSATLPTLLRQINVQRKNLD